MLDDVPHSLPCGKRAGVRWIFTLKLPMVGLLDQRKKSSIPLPTPLTEFTALWVQG